jgi:selenocysteine lyase/cysteine desulfurase
MRNYGGHILAVNTSVKDLAAIYRDQFTVFNNVTYMNSCSQGALADRVRASFNTYLHTMELNGSAWADWAGHQEKVRGLLAQVFNVSTAEMAVTTSASAAVSSLASSFDYTQKRNKIVTTENEFPTIGQIWHAQERRGARVVHVPSKADLTVDIAKLIEAIDDETLIVSVTMVCFRNGTMTELEPIIEAAHKKGALVLVDAYQGTGAVPIDLSTLKADFLVSGVLKYMLGAPGVGFMFARESTTKHLVPVTTGWFAARDIFAMDIHSYDPAKDARRFESGTPAIPALYPAAAGLEMLLEVGVQNIYDYVAPLHDEIREGIEAMGGTVVTPASRLNHGAMLAVASTDEHAHVAALEGEKVVTSSRDGNIRVSPHFYNNREDVEKVLAAFAKHKSFLRK